MVMHDLNCTHPKPHFTRMHYQLIADALASNRPHANFQETVNALADMFQKDNHTFDRGRFSAAAHGYREGYR